MDLHIFIPINEVAHYALYAFDMENKIVSILDPVRDISMEGKDIEHRHNKTKIKVSKALQECMMLAFPDWHEHIQNWEAKYPTSNLPDCHKYIPTHYYNTFNSVKGKLTYHNLIDRVDSAFHVLNYMRNWDGTRLVNSVPMVSAHTLNP